MGDRTVDRARILAARLAFLQVRAASAAVYRVLIDRAHEKSMEFIASLRMGATPGLDPSLSVANGGDGYASPQVVRHQLAVLAELCTDYPLDALELDFSASPGGSSLCFPYGSGPQHMGIMTGFLREAASIARAHGLQIGVRCYPTEEMNREMGLDLVCWLQEGLIDFCVPMLYIYFVLDANLPIEWLVEAAHDADASVYPVLQPYYAPDTDSHQSDLLPVTHHATIPFSAKSRNNGTHKQYITTQSLSTQHRKARERYNNTSRQNRRNAKTTHHDTIACNTKFGGRRQRR